MNDAGIYEDSPKHHDSDDRVAAPFRQPSFVTPGIDLCEKGSVLTIDTKGVFGNIPLYATQT
jgi:hypothetical protein